MNAPVFPAKGSFESRAAGFAMCGISLVGFALGGIMSSLGWFWPVFALQGLLCAYFAFMLMRTPMVPR